jgi:hypothetical protein
MCGNEVHSRARAFACARARDGEATAKDYASLLAAAAVILHAAEVEEGVSTPPPARKSVHSSARAEE